MEKRNAVAASVGENIMVWRSKKWLDRLKNSQLLKELRLMNSAQADVLARLIDTIESEGCSDIWLKSMKDSEGSVEVLLLFKIPENPSEVHGGRAEK